MWTVVVTRKFDAAHRLEGYPGKCSKMHGHTWKVRVGVSVERLDELGIGVDFGVLKEVVELVLKKVDHKVLNEVAEFREKNPTAEVIAEWLYGEVVEGLKRRGVSGEVEFVEVWESDDCYVRYVR